MQAMKRSLHVDCGIHFAHSRTNIRAYGRTRQILIFLLWKSNKISNFISGVSVLEQRQKLAISDGATILLGIFVYLLLTVPFMPLILRS